MKILHKYFWRDLYWQIRNYFWPQNKWLTKHIPNGWLDKDVLLEDIIAATIIEFVDGEKGFEVTVWDDTPNRLAVYHKLNNAYHWFKWQRQTLRTKEDQLLAHDFPFKREFQQFFSETQKWADLRAELRYDFAAKKEILDNLHLENVIKYRKHLWT